MARGVVDEAAHGLRDRVVALRDTVGGKSHAGGGLFASGVGFGLNDARRIAHCRGPGRYGLDHHRTAADARAIAHGEAPEHLRIGPHDHSTTQGGVALGPTRQRGAAQRDALVDGALVADLGGLTDHHAHAVVDEHPAADGGTGVDLDAGEHACQVRDEAAQPLVVGAPAGMRPTVHDQRMQTGVAGQHLPVGAGGRVALADAGDVFTQSIEHDSSVVLRACAC